MLGDPEMKDGHGIVPDELSVTPPTPHLVRGKSSSTLGSGLSGLSGMSATSGASASTGQSTVELPMKRLRAVISATRFNYAVGFIICVNTVLMGLELDQHDAAKPSDVMLATLSPRNIPRYFFDGFEVFFFVVLSLELAARISVYRKAMFYETATYIDLLALSPIVLLFGFDIQGSKHLTLIRIVRLVKLCRLLRLFRLFKELNMLAQSMAAASRALLWIGLLLFISVYCAAIVCTMIIGQSDALLQEDPVMTKFVAEYDEMAYAKRYWGSMTRSMVTLFQIFTLDDWNDIVRPVIETHQPWMLLFFICFVFVTTFGLLNLLMGTIVDRAISISKQDDEEKERILKNETKQVMLATVRLFSLIDLDENGRISAREISDFLENNDLHKVLEKEMVAFKIKIDYQGLVDICLKIAEDWMESCGPDADGITVEEFAGACARLQGPAKSQDLFSCMVMMKSTLERVESVERRLDNMERNVNRLVDLQTDNFHTLINLVGQNHRKQEASTSRDSTKASEREVAHDTEISLDKISTVPGSACSEESRSPPEVGPKPPSDNGTVVESVNDAFEDLPGSCRHCNSHEKPQLKQSKSSTTLNTCSSHSQARSSFPSTGANSGFTSTVNTGVTSGGVSDLVFDREMLARSGSQFMTSLSNELGSFKDLAQTAAASHIRRYSAQGRRSNRSGSREPLKRRLSRTSSGGGNPEVVPPTPKSDKRGRDRGRNHSETDVQQMKDKTSAACSQVMPLSSWD